MKYKKLLKFYKNISEINKFFNFKFHFYCTFTVIVYIYIYHIACLKINVTRHRK